MSILNEDFFDDERYLVHIEKSYQDSAQSIHFHHHLIDKMQKSQRNIYISDEIDNRLFRI